MCLSDDGQAGIVGAIGTASIYMDDVLDINNLYFGNMVSQMRPSGLQLGGTDTSDTEAAFSDLRLSVSGGGVSTSVCDGRGDFGFEVVSFPFLSLCSSLCILWGLCLSTRSYCWGVWPCCWLRRSRWVVGSIVILPIL